MKKTDKDHTVGYYFPTAVLRPPVTESRFGAEEWRFLDPNTDIKNWKWGLRGSVLHDSDRHPGLGTNSVSTA